MNRSYLLGLAAGIVGIGCGGGGQSSTGTDAAQLAAFQALGQQMTTEVSTYASETASLPDTAVCETAIQRHEHAMGQMLDRMREVSGWMDDHMAGATDADIACAVAAMQAQMAHQHANACTAPDPAGQEGDAAEHVCVMSQFMRHQRLRYEECGEHLRMMGTPEGETFSCVQNPDGSFTINGNTWMPGTPPSGVACDSRSGTSDTGAWPTPCAESGMMGCSDGGHHGMM